MAHPANHVAASSHLWINSAMVLLILASSHQYALAGRGVGSYFTLQDSSPFRKLTIEEGLKVDMIHVDSLMEPAAFHSPERLRRAVVKSINRAHMLALRAKGYSAYMNASSNEDSGADDVEASLAPVYSSGTGEFLLNLALGTPPQSFNGILDTGSDLVWRQSNPCEECFKEPDPLFEPSKSSTYKTLTCNDSYCNALPAPVCEGSLCGYYYSYGDGSTTMGSLSMDTLTIGNSSVDAFVFGAGFSNTGNIGEVGTDGIIGMGAGPLSLVSQMSATIGSKFSYCLGAWDSTKTSPLLFGSSATLSGGGVKHTSFLSSSAQPTFYYLDLKGISFNEKLLDIPPGTFDIESDGSGGIIIDSGTTVTILVPQVYSLIKEAYASTIKLPRKSGSVIGLDLCYDNSGRASVDIPPLTFHFDGADLELPKENIFFDFQGFYCLAMIATPSNININIFGNAQQQNIQFSYDKGTSDQLSFKPLDCTTI
ncbi:hypothetical protein L7F22_009986 [Adiantum nelumboides]|nr:hypothetical protein [Adiantum nelumboides]